MDKNLDKRRCPNCSQPYRLKSLSTGQKVNFPLFLNCGHVLCENCLRYFIHCLEPIECSICHQDMKIDATKVESVMKDNAQFYELFLINLVLVGELTVEDNQNIEGSEQDDEASHFFDLQSLHKGLQDKCMECEQLTTTKCKQCAINLCAMCFKKTHMNSVIFKNHRLQDIESNLNTNDCKTHTDKSLNHYCKDCVKAICIDCMIVEGGKSCHNHNVVTMQEMNKNLLEEVIAITPNIKETFIRLTKTAVDIGALQYAIVNDPGHESDLTKSLTDIGHYFSKLEAALLRHKMDIEKIIINRKCTVLQSLKAAKKDLTDRIKEAHCLIKSIESFDDPDKLKRINLSLFLEQVKAVIDAPWYLTKESNEGTFEITVKEELCDLVGGYIKLEDSAKCTYKLLSQSELGNVEIPPPPHVPVYRPELTKDVRQMNEPKEPVEIQQNRQRKPAFFESAPEYKGKKSSISSLDAIESYEVSESYITSSSQELIYISHIVHPHDFYVQRACHKGLVKEMLSEFQNAETLPIPSLSHATSGEMYLAFNKADNKWQRCRVLDIIRGHPEKYLFRVFFIDFGGTATLSINELRLLPPARVHSPYPLAIHCSLANCVPSKGCWFAEDSLLIHKIVNNKQAVMYVHHIRSTSEALVTLDVDLVTLEDGVNVAQALHFRERAKLLHPKLMVPAFPLMTEKPKILVNHNDFKHKLVEDVFITHIQNSGRFFVRKRDHQDTYNRLCEDLMRDYGSSDNSQPIYLPEKGMACVANIAAWLGNVEGALWARALVLELPGRARVSLALVDIGSEVVLHGTELRHIHNKYTAFKALATECYLSRVTPLHQKWCTDSVMMLHEYKNKSLQLHVEHTRKHNTLGVLKAGVLK